jgi:hypothetical protein
MPNKQQSIMLTPRTVRKVARSADAKPGSLSRLKQVQVRRLIQDDDSDSGGEEPRLLTLFEQRVRGAAAVSTSPPSPSDGPDAWRLACKTAEHVIKPPAISTTPQHDTPMSPGASPASVTPMALSVLHEWGTGLTIRKFAQTAACESTALSPRTTAFSPRTTTSTTALSPRTTSTALSPRTTTASAVKQWLRADDANEHCADRPKPRAAMAGGGRPKSSVGALLLQDTWGRFCVQALLPGRLALLIVGDAGCMSALLSSHRSPPMLYKCAQFTPKHRDRCAVLLPSAIKFVLVMS